MLLYVLDHRNQSSEKSSRASSDTIARKPNYGELGEQRLRTSIHSSQAHNEIGSSLYSTNSRCLDQIITATRVEAKDVLMVYITKWAIGDFR